MDIDVTGTALFQSMIEQAGEAIIFVDRSGTIQVWNRGAENIFGYSAAEARAGGLDIIIPERLRKAHWDGFSAAVKAGRTLHGDRVLTTRAVHKNGRKIYVDLSFCLIRDASNTVRGAMAVGRDCTERYLADKVRVQPPGTVGSGVP